MNNNAEIAFFFSKWLQSPLSVASMIPSSSRLARTMASALPETEGLVIELGAGTGPITTALLQAGVPPEHLVVIERDRHFHRHLQRRFPGVTILCGDGLELHTLVENLPGGLPVRAVVSSLPLLSMNAYTQRRLLTQAMPLIRGNGPFIQFSYSLLSPVKRVVADELDLSPHCVARVWRNVPPAKVWTYRQLVPCDHATDTRPDPAQLFAGMADNNKQHRGARRRGLRSVKDAEVE